VSRYEPIHIREIMASPFIKKSFEDVGCLGFCERIQEVGCHAKLKVSLPQISRRIRPQLQG
jgi:hypothetical protein